MLRSFLGLDRRSSLENPKVSLQDVDGWNALYGDRASESGVRVTKKQALWCAAVWNAVALISGTGARLPLDKYTKSGDQRAVDEAHPAHWVVRHQANREQAAFFFWRQIFCHLLTYNRAYAFLDQDRPGRPREAFVLLPDRTAPERLRARDLLAAGKTRELAEQLDGQLVFTTEVGGQLKTFFPSQILHFRGISLDGLDGLDLIDHARQAIGLALAQQKFASRFFKNGARMGGTLQIPAAMKKSAADKLEEGFRKKYEEEGEWFKTVILREGAQFHQAAFSPVDSQLVEATEAQARQVARYYKLPPSKLGLSDSVSYNSKAEDNQAFLDDTCGDLLAMIVAECWMKLLSPAEQQARTHYFEHNTAALLRLDLLKRYQAYKIAVGRPFMLVNEARARENLPPIEGGDELAPASPGAASPARQPAAGDAGDAANEAGNEAGGDRSSASASSSSSLPIPAALRSALAARIRHKVKSGSAAFQQFLDRNLADFRADYPEIPTAWFDAMVADLRRFASMRTGTEAIAAALETQTPLPAADTEAAC